MPGSAVLRKDAHLNLAAPALVECPAMLARLAATAAITVFRADPIIAAGVMSTRGPEPGIATATIEGWLSGECKVSSSAAPDNDLALLDAFRRWCAAEAVAPPDDDVAAAVQDSVLDDLALAIAIMPVVGLTGLSIKFYMALHAEAGGAIDNPISINMRHWHEGQLPHDLIAGALADMMRLNPAIAAIVGTSTFV